VNPTAAAKSGQTMDHMLAPQSVGQRDVTTLMMGSAVAGGALARTEYWRAR
jgi:hypothetical protein